VSAELEFITGNVVLLFVEVEEIEVLFKSPVFKKPSYDFLVGIEIVASTSIRSFNNKP
jgi:hypothetical protein